MFSFYIFKNKTIDPNILLISTIDNCENHNLDLIIDEIINSLLENNFINLKNNIIFCIIDRETEIKNFFLNQGIEAKQLNLKSEANLRFEKGLNPQLAEFAIKRAIRMILEICGGESYSGLIDEPKDG